MKNFNEIKQHLKELADIVNMFKSEAVQLRVVELVFGAEEDDSEEQKAVVPAAPHTAKRSKRRKPSRTAAAGKAAGDASSAGAQDSGPKETKGRKASRAGKGAVAVLSTLKEKGFFQKPQTIRTIVDHSKNSLGLTFKQSDFSGPLVRAVRDELLVRRKNNDNQYEYTET